MFCKKQWRRRQEDKKLNSQGEEPSTNKIALQDPPTNKRWPRPPEQQREEEDLESKNEEEDEQERPEM